MTSLKEISNQVVPEGYRLLNKNEKPRDGDLVYKSAEELSVGKIIAETDEWCKLTSIGDEYQGILARKL